MQEPPLQFFLEGEEQPIPIEIDKPFQLGAEAAKGALTLRVKPTRTFKISGVSFLYQKHYAFEVTRYANLTSWKLSGSSNILMLWRYNKTLDHKKFLQSCVDNMIARCKPENIKHSDASLELDGHKLVGQKLEITLATQSVHTEVYSFAVNETAYVLVIQDKPCENGQPSAEFVQQMKLLKESFQITEEKQTPKESR